MNFKYLFLFVLLGGIIYSCNTAKKRHQYMHDMFTDIKKAVPDAEIQIVEDSIKMIFRGATFFNSGETDLLESNYPKFKRLADVLNKYTKTQILILGHTDDTGSDEANMKLSEARALSAKDRLIYEKVEPARLSSWGMGETSPVADNSTPEGQAQNRRLEFVILYSID